MTPHEIFDLPLWVECSAVGSGALFGAFSAINERMAVTGVFALSVVGGVGGGIIRDTLVQQGPPVALSEPVFLVVPFIAAVIAITFARALGLSVEVPQTPRLHWSRSQSLANLILIFDAVAVGIYAIVGVNTALNAGLPNLGSALVGVLSGTGGSVLLDLLIGRPPALLRPGILLGVAAAAGCAMYATSLVLDVPGPIAAATSAALVAGLRIGAVHFGWAVGPIEPKIRPQRGV